jgi:3-phosphoshikimate 1-carboxyvinyltransferase
MAAIDRTPWPAPQARGPLSATVELPGSKSLTNRAVVLAALSTTPTRITAPLLARDTVLMADALRSLGVDIAPDAANWLVHPGAVRAGTVDCGLAGTVMRFLPAVAALARGDSVFDGDPHARTRPMRTLLEGLRQAGVNVDDGGTGLLPFTVRGQGTVSGGVLELDASASSQFVSGLLLSGARFDKGVEIHHVGGALPSQPHIDMTVSMLREAGVAVDDTQPNRWVVAPGPIDLPDTVIEPDLSNAAPFLAAALVAGGSVTVPRWPSHTTQAGDALRDLLTQMGGSVSLAPSGLTVSGAGSVGPLVADLHDVGELTPVLAALAALADGESHLTGVAHIRGHETDRLSALAAELESFGADVDELPDGLVIRPAQLSGGIWHAYADHRMAQAGAVLGLRVPGVEVDDIASTTKTMADFPALWTSLLEQPLAE